MGMNFYLRVFIYALNSLRISWYSFTSSTEKILAAVNGAAGAYK